jgi:hypothetical protein
VPLPPDPVLEIVTVTKSPVPPRTTVVPVPPMNCIPVAPGVDWTPVGPKIATFDSIPPPPTELPVKNDAVLLEILI